MPFQLDIVTPEKTIFSDTVDDVYLPGSEGEMGILASHAALVAPLQPGELHYLKDGKVEELAGRRLRGGDRRKGFRLD